ncbi:MAG: aspartate dehydrogenase [Alphaproteobacteria bacterium]|nr:aspartate dehydrogenase [Alphaproteobacteria bacterium]MCB9928484.1 aspartate dehydrogenase [Alphaproteobacteria bacterium]
MSLTVGIGSFGTIGRQVARLLDAGGIPGLSLALVSAQDRARAAERMADFHRPVPVVDLADLAACDVVLEAAPAVVFEAIAAPAIEAGRIFLPTSVGALLPRRPLVERAAETGARIIVPTGALLGLDAVRAAAEGTIHTVAMVTRKPPRGLVGAPYLVENAISVEGLSAPKLVFEGSVRAGAAGFPANVNVAAALSLACAGPRLADFDTWPDRITLQIWADPGVDRNTHHITVDSDSARFSLDIATIPTEENPRTGKITALSVIACLRSLTQTLKVGT